MQYAPECPTSTWGSSVSLRSPLPDLATQTAIADVLGALDDKIAANERATALAMRLVSVLGRPTGDGSEVALRGIASLVARGRAPKYADDGPWVVNQKCVRDGLVGLSSARRATAPRPGGDRPLQSRRVTTSPSGRRRAPHSAAVGGRLGWSRKRVDEVVGGQAPITADAAIQFERVTGIPADSRLRLRGRVPGRSGLARGRENRITVTESLTGLH